MITKISPGFLKGVVKAPPSKSIMQRALAGALLHTGITHIYNPGSSKDELAAMNIIRALGARIEQREDKMVIFSPGYGEKTSLNSNIIHCGESGLSARMFAPIAALSNAVITFTGEGSLPGRSMDFIETVLPQCDVQVQSTAGKLPLTIQGPLHPRDLSIDAADSSQYLSGMLFAFSAAVTRPTTITVSGLKSRPYIDLTMEILAAFGFIVEETAFDEFTVHPFQKPPNDIHITVEGDWSNAAFLLVAGAIAGSIRVTGLNQNSKQGDRSILTVLKSCGAALHQEVDFIEVKKGVLTAFEFDATNCPDLFPPLVALASCCTGTSTIAGVSRLAGKESDRAAALQEVFTAMGIDVCIKGDSMMVTGGRANSAVVSSHNDHRIAMAAAVAALRATGPVVIENAQAVQKSYPAFFSDLNKLGAVTEVIEP